MSGVPLEQIDLRRQFWQQKISTPFFMSNISIFVCMYHLVNAETGEYTMILSSKGNEDLVAKSAKLFGSDTIGNAKINAWRLTPIKKEDGTEDGVKVTHLMIVNPPGAP